MTARSVLGFFSIAFGVMGLVFVLSPSLTLSFFDWMVYGGYEASPVQADLMDGETRRYAGFIYQVLGAVLFGWAVLLTLVIRGPQLDTGDTGDTGDTKKASHLMDAWTWRVFAASFAAWFVVDTTMSLATGFWQNAVFNTLFGIAVAVPLVLGWRTATHR